jgi:7-cyano-7-deazaguanine synthase
MPFSLSDLPPPSHREAVVMVSGGVDSTTLSWWLSYHGVKQHPLFVDYGQHCADTELDAVRRNLPLGLGVTTPRINVGDVYKGSRSRLILPANLNVDQIEDDHLHVPYRNLLILTVGAAVAATKGVNAIFAAFIASNHVVEIDASALFLNNVTQLLGAVDRVVVETPFRDMNKAEIVQLSLALGAPLAFTFSCQAASVMPCGACPNCVERQQAFDSAVL